ncbi:hypothetical protein ZWY2020_046731 [Hordeum vulgare]|nr:hypothetical protein ZWY2020_046731 [Hordeum vulgare]
MGQGAKWGLKCPTVKFNSAYKSRPFQFHHHPWQSRLVAWLTTGSCLWSSSPPRCSFPAAGVYPWTICGLSTYAAKSQYLANINRIGATLPRNASQSPDLFATALVGAVPQQVWALALCRGDANASYCFTCLDQAFQDLPNACPYSRDSTIYYDSCVLHYSNIQSRPDDDTTYNPTRPLRNNFNATAEAAVPARRRRAPQRHRQLRRHQLHAALCVREADFDQGAP